MNPRDLEDLSRKYRLLLTLREEKARGEPPPPRSVFLALSREFPGSLRELDRLSLEILHARIEALDVALLEGETLPWMPYVAALHHLVRAGLRARERRVDDDSPIAEASRHVRAEIAKDFIRDARGRGGPLRRLAVCAIASHHGATIESIANALEPSFRAPLKHDRIDPDS